MPSTGGCVFALNPKLSAPETTPLWRPEVLPSAVILQPSQVPTAQPLRIASSLVAQATAQFDADDGLHIRLAGNHQLWLPDKTLDGPLAVIIPLDTYFALRAAGALRFYKQIKSGNSEPPLSTQRLTSQQRARLVLMLRALNGRKKKATYREIATALFGLEITTQNGWKTDPVRGKTIRLVKDAVSMANLGYLRLLRGRPPR